MTYLADTNVLSEVMRRAPNPAVATRWPGRRGCVWELGPILATRNVEGFRGFGVPLLDPFT